MTRPATSSRLLLIEDRRAGAEVPAGVPVRRYRLARLRFDGPAADSGGRFEHLKRAHD
ncbi:MAG: hypothetical protein JO244_03570 [Solirubrobacterales bacterium]|jgi:hypothetical protein|nr:hypothetical protein [Solirubrobacterales bacterium]